MVIVPTGTRLGTSYQVLQHDVLVKVIQIRTTRTKG